VSEKSPVKVQGGRTSVRSYTLPSITTQQSSGVLCFSTSENGIRPCETAWIGGAEGSESVRSGLPSILSVPTATIYTISHSLQPRCLLESQREPTTATPPPIRHTLLPSRLPAAWRYEPYVR
jgi:hypothetical protein